ncbi:uncharacterized protein LOC111044867 [Nilaparvata lugens]|uniref:uncharacterized protein LOC111044867 n=1 Tax=Nilaparvata lugens TaxID=108931 RepID=UPI00193DE73F|nr:uncharacterized protein LOC111044867 [Nilaparvata lugens]
MVDTTKEQIVMTPKGRTANQTNLIIERKAVKIENNSDKDNIHVAGGDHQGIVINKFVASGKPIYSTFTQIFPDYVGFIKKLMKLMQLKYTSIKKVEVIIRKLDEPEKLPSRPLSADESIFGKQIPITEERVLELIESSYPNPVTIKDMVKEHSWSDEDIVIHIKELQKKKLVKAMEHGAFTRVVSHDPDIQIVKQMPTMVKAKQPTIAIITAQYCEKLAVDAMIENKETFVRYTTVGVKEYSKDGATIKRQTRFGESNVYTLGNMGAHRIVCTKLPTVGHTREAMTAAGNTTTRLLGTFQKVDYVILVGLGGGVPHYTDFNKHVRLGDVVVAHSTNNNRCLPTGESNVYTLGNMGAHRIVCTKLPTVGHTREAMTAAGNTTTRLLGTFQKVDYVILVGLGGGVPHYTDFNKHVRLGDVVVAHSTNNNRAVYTYCENANERPDGQLAFDHKDYQPSNFCLQHIASQLKAQSEAEGDAAPWLKYLVEAENMLSSAEAESDFRRPPKETDKLYMSIGEEGVIEVAHPTSTDPDLQKRLEGRSRIHTGVIASGRAVCRNEQLRQQFSEQRVALAWDSEFDSVIESVQGNCKDCFALVRGISDYKDGTRKSPWQPYAALAAAAVVKAIVCAMDPPTDA